MRWVWLALLLAASCDETKNITEGQKVTVSSGDTVIVKGLHIDVTSTDDGLMLRMTDGAHTDARLVSGTRIVKLGAHRIRFDETGSRVTIVVHAYKPSSPLSSDDALLAADEAMSPKSTGPVDCTSATLSPDGASYMVQCRDTNVSDTAGRIVKVDAATGAILSI